MSRRVTGSQISGSRLLAALGLLLAGLHAGVVACGTNDGARCRTGALGCPCNAKSTCEGELSCEAGLCVRERTTNNSNDEGDTMVGGSGGTASGESMPSDTENGVDEPASYGGAGGSDDGLDESDPGEEGAGGTASGEGSNVDGGIGNAGGASPESSGGSGNIDGEGEGESGGSGATGGSNASGATGGAFQNAGSGGQAGSAGSSGSGGLGGITVPADCRGCLQEVGACGAERRECSADEACAGCLLISVEACAANPTFIVLRACLCDSFCGETCGPLCQ